MPRVSVILPAFNSEAFLADAIESVARQGFGDLELVVVDDGSDAPGPGVLIEELGRSVSFPIRFLSQKNQGPGAARNLGLECGDSEFVAFLDADDIFEADKLSWQVPLLASKPAHYSSVCGGHRVVPIGGGTPFEVRPGPADGPIYSELVREELVLLGTPAFLHRRRALVDVGGYDPGLRNNEDLDLTLRLARRFSLVTHPEIVFENRQRAGSASNADPRLALGFALKFLAKLEREDPALEKGILRRRRQKAYFNAARQLLVDQQDFGAFRETLDEGIRCAGYPRTWRGWSAWLFARTGPLGSLIVGRRPRPG